MSEDWEIKKLNEVCEVRPSKRQVKKKLNEDDIVTYVPMSELGIDQKYFSGNEERAMGDAYKGYTYFEEGDVVLAKITPCFENGKLGIAKDLKNGVGFGSTEFIPYRTGDQIIPEYLYYYLNQSSFRKKGERLMTGAVGHKRLPKDFYEEYEIPVPPLDEQKRIVAILDEAFEAIDQAKANIEQNIENGEELFQSKLEEIFSKKENGWEIKKLGEIIELISGQHIKTDNYNSEGRGIGYLTGPSDFGDVHPKITKWTEHPKKTARANDILITVKGSGVGKINLLDENEIAISRQLKALRVKEANIQFVYSFLENRFDHIQALANGAAIPGLSIGDIENLEISLPNRNRQDELVKEIKTLQQLKTNITANYKDKIISLNELKKSILQKGFSGKLTRKEELVA